MQINEEKARNRQTDITDRTQHFRQISLLGGPVKSHRYKYRFSESKY